MAVQIFNRASLRGFSALSLALTLGAGLSGAARAQSSSFNGTQATTFTLTSGVNTSTFTFGPNTNIGPTAINTNGVNGDTLTSWNVINQGQISGGANIANGIILNTVGGNSVTNSGSVTGSINGVALVGTGSTLTNLAGGTLTGAVSGASLGYSSTLINAGLIQGNANVGSGSIVNQAGGTITGNAAFVAQVTVTSGTLTNAGAIGGEFTSSGSATVNNQAGGSIAGGVDIATSFLVRGPGTVTNAGSIGRFGVLFNYGGSVTNSGTITGTTINPATGSTAGVTVFEGSGNVTNLAGGAITGGTDGIQYSFGQASGNVVNAGSITGTTGNGVNFSAGGSLTNQAGGTITGAVNGVLMVGNIAFANPVINAGIITGTTGDGVFINGSIAATVTNLAGGTVSGVIGIETNALVSTVINAGTITGTGGAAISFDANTPSTLILRTGSVINGKVVSAVPFMDSLYLQGTGSANNNFAGWEALNVQASGLWALNGVSSFSGTLVNSGTLVVGDASHPGAQIAGSVQVDSGGALAGQGTVNGNVTAASGGTIAPGAASPFSTLNVTGNTQFNSGSFFNVNVNAAGQSDKLALGGAATLTGGIVQVLTPAGNYAAQTSYTILTAGTRNSTTFAGVTDYSIFLAPSLSYPSQQQAVLTLTALPFASAAGTANQTAVANALNGGAQNALTALLFGQTSITGARQAFDALSGEIYGSVKNTLADQTQFTRNAALGRLRQDSYADTDDDTAALVFGGPALAYDERPDYPKFVKPGSARRKSGDVTFWSQGFGGIGRVDGNGSAATLRSNFGGVLTGVDALFGTVRAGILAGYSHSTVKVDARASSAGIDTAHLGAYAGTSFGALHLRSGAAASFNSIDSSRAVAFAGFADNTRARFNGYTAQAFGEVGYGTSINQVALEPFAGLSYVMVNTAAFQESGGLAALTAASTTESLGYSSLGLRAATVWMLPNGTALMPHGSVQWEHAFGQANPTVAVAFQSTGAAFTTSGVPIASNTALVEGVLDWRITAQIKLGVGYQGELAQHAQTHTAKGNFTWNF